MEPRSRQSSSGGAHKPTPDTPEKRAAAVDRDGQRTGGLWRLGSERTEQLQAGVCFVAIALCFLVYGVLQERLVTIGFGPQRELFRWSLFIVFCNRLLTCTTALLVLMLQVRFSSSTCFSLNCNRP